MALAQNDKLRVIKEVAQVNQAKDPHEKLMKQLKRSKLKIFKRVVLGIKYHKLAL